MVTSGGTSAFSDPVSQLTSEDGMYFESVNSIIL